MLSRADLFWLVCGNGRKEEGYEQDAFHLHQKSSLYNVSVGGLGVSDLQSLISTVALHFTTSHRVCVCVFWCCVLGSDSGGL